MSERHFWWHDTTLCVASPGMTQATIRGRDGGRIPMAHTNPDWPLWAALMRTLKGIGLSVEDDARIAARYPSLRATHREGFRGDLRWHGETYPTGCKIVFFQDLVTVNPNGGRYDFDRLAKMPYPVRLGFLRARRALDATLRDLGLTDTTKATSPNPDPLRYFNDAWDGAYEKRHGVHRFERDETGWPSGRELAGWPQRDRDGAPLAHGAIRYARDGKGRLLRGRVYGGINGMWMFVYGPGRADHTHAPADRFFSWHPDLPRKAHPDPASSIKRRLDAAVKAQAFERAIPLRNALRRLAERGQPAPERSAA